MTKKLGSKNYWKSVFMDIIDPYTNEKIGVWQVNIYDLAEGYSATPKLDINHDNETLD